MPALSAVYLFSVSNLVCFSFMSVSQAAQRRTCFTQCRTLPKIWVGTVLVRSLYLRGKIANDFELILTVKMETRHTAKGLFVSEFPAICNHCGVMAALYKSQDVTIL